MKSPTILHWGTLLLFVTLSACGGGGSGDGPSPMLLELSPVSGGATTSDAIRVEGRTSQPVSAVVVGGQSALVDPLTQRFSLVVPLAPGRNVLDVDLVLPDGRIFGDVAGVEVLRAAGPEALIESLVVSPGGERFYFVEDTGDRWLTELVVATGARQRIANLGPPVFSPLPLALFWNPSNARLLFGTDTLESYDPLSGTTSPLGSTPTPNVPVLDWSAGATAQSGFSLVGVNAFTRVYDFDFAQGQIAQVPLPPQNPGLAITTIDYDAIQNRLVTAVATGPNGTLSVLTLALSGGGEWVEAFNLGDSGVPIERRVAVAFAPAQRRIVIAYDKVDIEGMSAGMTLRSIDVESGLEVMRELPRASGHLISVRPGLTSDPTTGRLHLAFGRSILALDPLTLDTLETIGALTPPSSGVSDTLLAGSVRLDPNRTEVLQLARRADGRKSLVSSSIASRQRRRVAEFQAGFSFQLLGIDDDRDVALGYLTSDSGPAFRPIARIDLKAGLSTEVALLPSLPFEGGVPLTALAVQIVPISEEIRIFTSDNRLFQLGDDQSTWTQIPLPSIDPNVRWTPNVDGEMLGLFVVPGAGSAQEFSALRLDLNAALLTATGTVDFNAPQGALTPASDPQRIGGGFGLAQRFADPGGQFVLIHCDVENGMISSVLDAATDSFGLLGNFATSTDPVEPQLIQGIRPNTVLVSFQARSEQSGTSLAEVDILQGSTLLLQR